MNPETMDLRQLGDSFEAEGYICGEEILIPVYLALSLDRPLLVEGEPGVGKTEIAKVLSRILRCPLIRLQCYEGLDETKALYEWNYHKQLLRIQMVKDRVTLAEMEAEIFSEDCLLERPLLKAIRSARKSVLLIDEVDRADEEFEAFLFEILAEFQVSIPEMGTIRAAIPPVVVLTSNRSRELSNALKRRCLYLYIDFPSVAKEMKIVTTKVPGISPRLASQMVRVVQRVRADERVVKKPSVAESLDWARALKVLGVSELSADCLARSLNLILKSKEDLDCFGDPERLGEILAEAAE